MTEKQEVATRDRADVQNQGREPELALRPAVDIFEDAEGITVLADMPGVTRDRLNVQVDKNNLLIEGDAQIDVPEGMEALYADVHATHYRRAFSLSSELEAEKVDASLKDGVLTLRIPKRAELQPRKIEVRTA